MALRFSSILFLVFAFGAVYGQSFFKKVPQPFVSFRVVADSVQASETATTMNAFRPIANISSYAIPENALLTGTGISYQHLKWNGTKWVAQWSANALAWYKTSLDGSKNAFAYGLAVGFFNNLVLIGGATDSHSALATIGLGISLN